jgi:hypothetical protein
MNALQLICSRVAANLWNTDTGVLRGERGGLLPL